MHLISFLGEPEHRSADIFAPCSAIGVDGNDALGNIVHDDDLVSQWFVVHFENAFRLRVFTDTGKAKFLQSVNNLFRKINGQTVITVKNIVLVKLPMFSCVIQFALKGAVRALLVLCIYEYGYAVLL